MYFHKIHHPVHFRYDQNDKLSSSSAPSLSSTIHIEEKGDDIFILSVNDERAPVSSLINFNFNNPKRKSECSLNIEKSGAFCLTDQAGKTLLRSYSETPFGVCKSAWVFQLKYESDMRFYGMGEKNIGFERSEKKTKFWNSDVWADFPPEIFRESITDPMYVSIPWLIIKQQNTFVGILIDNPHEAFISTCAGSTTPGSQNGRSVSNFYVGATKGQPRLLIIVGPSLKDLTQKLQRLVGTTPLPPLWALGHHQCRWGYESLEDLLHLDEQFRQHKIPNDGLWLDIDYMDGFRVFTFNPEHFPSPRENIAKLQKLGRHVVPILDPGVKDETGYSVREDGIKKNIFCKNSEGLPYLGFVWPGATLFPDYSLPEGREWWASWCAEFFSLGFSGAWIDMNDPAVGSQELEEMLFSQGTLPHDSFHNLYGTAMAMATRTGFQRAHPTKRPFLITRSGSTGIAQYAAVWTGDNCSNWFHLKKSIEVSLHLALSGVPFNGPDVPGFGEDATPELAVAWYKLGFLFPFLRNHSYKGSHKQEPWQFGERALTVIRHYIRLRYKLLPYLYNLFIDQEEKGEAILRPLFYDFEDSDTLSFEFIDDQFLVGPHIMQAPIMEKKKNKRMVTLPQGSWFETQSGSWLTGSQTIEAKQTFFSTPLFIRNGAILPMQKGERECNNNDLKSIEFHIFIDPKTVGNWNYTYRFDEGEGHAYKEGQRSQVEVSASAQDGKLCLSYRYLSLGYGKCHISFVVHGDWKSILCEEHAFQPDKWNFTGKVLRVMRSSGREQP